MRIPKEQHKPCTTCSGKRKLTSLQDLATVMFHGTKPMEGKEMEALNNAILSQSKSERTIFENNSNKATNTENNQHNG